MGKNEVPGEITAIFTYSNFVKITTNHQLLTHLGHEPEFKREPTKLTERARFCPVNSAASAGQDVVYITVRYRCELFRLSPLSEPSIHCAAMQCSLVKGAAAPLSPQVAGQLWTLTKPHPNLCEDLGASSVSFPLSESHLKTALLGQDAAQILLRPGASCLSGLL